MTRSQMGRRLLRTLGNSGIFVNYFASPRPQSAFNISFARVLIGLYSIWKLLSYDIDDLQNWPIILFDRHQNGLLLFSEGYLQYLLLEQWVLVIALGLFVLGWRLGLTAFLSALLLAHLTALHYVPSNAATTFLPAVYSLILFGLFRENETRSLYKLTRVMSRIKGALGGLSEPGREQSVDMSSLKWIQLLFALTYFFTGFSKLANAGPQWASAENFALILNAEAIMNLNELPAASQFLISSSGLSSILAWATLVLECGFVIALLLRAPLTPFFIGLAGMHVAIAATMGILFFDQFVFFALFVSWDSLYSQRRRNQRIRRAMVSRQAT